MRKLVCFWLMFPPLWLAAQTAPRLAPGGLIQLQVAQPGVDVTTPVTAEAGFDPPVVSLGEKAFYRVNINATESAIQWPDSLPGPATLHFGAKRSGQITELEATKFRPHASFLYEVEPDAVGQYTVTNFNVSVADAVVSIPAASLDVAPKTSGLHPARQLLLETEATNVYLGQPFHVRVILPSGPGNQAEVLSGIEFSGDGLMIDKASSHQSIGPISVHGVLMSGFVAELAVKPMTAGHLKFSAQAFTVGSQYQYAGNISIRGPVTLSVGPPKYELLVSDPLEIHVRPVPTEGELPGYTGAIGKFFQDPPHLSTNRLQVGEPLQLKLTFHGQGDLSRFVPPLPPRSRQWQVIADPPPATTFTLIPLTDEARETPAIPFSYFDPETGVYEDLTIPAQPVTVVG